MLERFTSRRADAQVERVHAPLAGHRLCGARDPLVPRRRSGRKAAARALLYLGRDRLLAAVPLRSTAEGEYMFPVMITFRDMDPSESVEDQIRRSAEKLGRYSSRIRQCSVSVDVPHKHHVHGYHYRVRIQLALPGGDVVIGQHGDDQRVSTDLHAAIDTAFDEAGRVVAERQRRYRAKQRTESHPLAVALEGPEAVPSR
jgi:ribosome-associated translation inhibitor RaiA